MLSQILYSSALIARIIIQYNNFLLTEREVCTEKYRTEDFFVQTEPVGRGLYKKTEFRYFQASELKSWTKLNLETIPATQYSVQLLNIDKTNFVSRPGAALQGGGGGWNTPHSSANRQIIISVGKTGLAKDNH